MALIKCPECGKEISDTIDSCIHCGYKVKKDTEEINKIDNNSADKEQDEKETPASEKSSMPGCTKALLLVLMLLVVVVIFFGVVSATSNNTNADTTSGTTAPAVTDIDLNTIHEELVNNELVATEKYEGKRYRAKNIAIVDDIKEDYVTATVVTNYKSTYEYFHVKLYYGFSERNIVRELKKYDFITFEGTLSDLYSELWMFFEDVFIDKIEEAK